MANTRRTSHDTSKNATATTALSNTSPSTLSPAKANAYPILDNPIFVHEPNNNSIIGSNNALTTAAAAAAAKPDMLHGLPEMFTDIDLTNHSHLNGAFINGNLYKPYILGKCFSAVKKYLYQ